MAKVHLSKLLARRRELALILEDLISQVNPEISIWDHQGNLLFGDGEGALGRLAPNVPIAYKGEIYGWASGVPSGDKIAALLSQVIEWEFLKKALVEETLGLMREINLLFRLSKRLSDTLAIEVARGEQQPFSTVTHIARLALNEAQRRILSTVGVVMIYSDDLGNFQLVEPTNIEHQAFPAPELLEAITREAVSSRKAEIVNLISSDQRYAVFKGDITSFVCAPLIARSQVLGIILLASEDPVTYKARDLKLLVALVSQLTPVIEYALLHEIEILESKVREAELRKRNKEMINILDEVRQKEKVAEIIESEYFQYIHQQASSFRKKIGWGE
jgi:putative methionine-R-sulfoxide reductase with GAF domain